MPDVVDRDRVVAVGALDDDRLLADAVGRQDRDLRLVDDRQRHARAERTHVRDRERAADDLVGTELLAPGARREVADLTRDQPQPLAVGVADHRRDEALEVEVDRDAEVDVVVHDERLAVDARVDVRVVVHDVAERAHDERQVGEREALLGLPLRLVRAAHALDALEVDLDRRVDVRARRLRPHHVLGGAPADVVERDDLVAGARRDTRGCRRRAERRGAGAGAAARARRAGAGAAASRAASSTSLRVMRPPSPVPRIVRGIEPVLGDQPAHDRRRRPMPPPSVAGAGAARRGRRRGRAVPAAGRGRTPERRRLAARAAPVRLRAGAARRRLGLGGGAAAARRARRGAPARAAPSPITARRAPTSTVSPSGTRISVTHARAAARAPRSRPCRSRPRTAARRRRRARRPA